MAVLEWHIGDHVLVRGAAWLIRDATTWPDCTLLQLSSLVATRQRRRLLTPFDRPQRLVRSRTTRVVRPRRWLHDLRRAAASVTPYGGAIMAAAASVRLLPHQLEPLLAILKYGATRLLIADAVGLGKTIQAGLVLLELSARHVDFRGIVLVPAGLREQWHQELRERFGVAAFQADAAWLRATTAEQPPDVNPWTLPGVYIASIDFAKRAEVLRALEDVTWDVMVLDEAHLASASSDRRAAAHAIGSRSNRTVLLTATPGTGDPQAFTALCALGALDRQDPPVMFFRRTRADVQDGPSRRSSLLRVRPTRAERRMHELLERYTRRVWQESSARGDARAKLATIVLRKRALSSAASLAVSAQRRLALLVATPVSSGEQLLLPLADEDALEDDVADGDLGAPGLADARRERRWLAAVAEAARHAARAESKASRLLRWLRRVREPVIVFTEYRDTLHRLERLIRTTGRTLTTIHGGLDRAERNRAQAIFNAGGVSLLATDAAAEGLNLHHHCRIVLHYELPWRPARIEQRAGRVDRLGQSKRVHEIALVAADTVERLVLAPLMTRAARARAAGDVTAGLLDSLSESAVSELVIGGVAPPSYAQDVRMPIPTRELRDEAAAEVARLETVRRWRQKSGEPPGHSRRVRAASAAVIRSGGSAIDRGIILAFDLSLKDVEYRVVHSEVSVDFIEHCQCRLLEVGTSPRRIVETVRAEYERTGTALQQHVTGQLERLMQQVAPLRAAALRIERQRAEALRFALPSAARELVQAGLFDRRAIDATARKRAVHAIHIDAVDERLESLERNAPLIAQAELVAVLVVR